MIDNALPMVAAVLHRQYREARRAYVAEASRLIPTMSPWPKRRSKRRPIPGVIDAPTDSEG
jgi:hypothetical protein